ncbi:hypothetical protein ACWD0Z_07610 [Streptomyces sp. NPDC003007]
MTTATAQVTAHTARRHPLPNRAADGSLGPEGENLLVQPLT